jgi:hypothetical protein
MSTRVDRRWPVAVVALGVIAIVARTYRLDAAPGEWYGDISTLYESSLALRRGDLPPGWFIVGVGPLYPLLLWPVLSVIGVSYLAMKVTSVVISLVGLLLLYRLSTAWFGRSVALMITAVASVSSWWLVFSRLGDQQALNPTLVLAAVVCADRARRAPDAVGWPVAAGVLSSAGLYLYGNSFVLPLITAALLGGSAVRRRELARSFTLFGAAGVLAAWPILLEYIRERDVVRAGHVGSRFVTGWEFFPNLVVGYWRALGAYVTEGDSVFRSNVMGAPHLDRLSLIAAFVGAAVLVTGVHRRKGWFIIASFLLLHLPSVLAGSDEVPSAGRTLAAAPFAYMLVGVGLWAGVTSVRQMWSPRAGEAVAVGFVSIVAVVNLHHYFGPYLDGLPYGNTPIAREITDFADALDPGVEVHLVGGGWGPNGMPEPKSIRYVMHRPERLVEHEPDGFDCAALRRIRPPAVVVWSFAEAFPSPDIGACAGTLTDVRIVEAAPGRPVFAVGEIGVPAGGAED